MGASRYRLSDRLLLAKFTTLTRLLQRNKKQTLQLLHTNTFKHRTTLMAVLPAADAMLETDTAVSSSVLSLHRHFSVKHFTCPEMPLPVDVLSGYALLNASRTAANDRDAKQCLRMKTRSAHEYEMLASAQLLRNWLSSGLTTRVSLTRVAQERLRVYCQGWICLWFHFCSVMRDCYVLNSTPCVSYKDILHVH
jgi:hypothetical protein